MARSPKGSAACEPAAVPPPPVATPPMGGQKVPATRLDGDPGMISTRPVASLLLILGSLVVEDAVAPKAPLSPPKANIKTVAVASPPGLMLPSEKSTEPSARAQDPWVVVAERGPPSEP